MYPAVYMSYLYESKLPYFSLIEFMGFKLLFLFFM